MNRWIPYIIAVAFITLLVSNNVMIEWRKDSIYRDLVSIDEPVREVLALDDFLADEKDAETLVINLWATWCQPCAREIPQLNKLVDKYEQDGVLFLGINGEEKDKVMEWMDLQKHEFIYFQLYDQKKLMNYLFQVNPDPNFKTGRKPQHLPTNLIFHKGELVYFKSGYTKESVEALDAKLNELIGD